jgi:hypothetical protein
MYHIREHRLPGTQPYPLLTAATVEWGQPGRGERFLDTLAENEKWGI